MAKMTAASFFKAACVLWTLTSSVGWGLRLGAFNVKVFGPTKADKLDVMTILAKIAARYDILLVQEVKDVTGQAILKLLQRIEDDHGIVMRMNISNRLGRTHSKEQYAFLYREDQGISVVDSFHFNDTVQVENEIGSDDLFQREPYIVRIQASNCRLRDFSLVALHTMPTQTVKELQSLTQVVRQVRQVWGTDNVMVLGDLNAACAYVPKKAWPTIPLKHDSNFWWAIEDNVDTTVNNNTDCAYDRFIISGNDLIDAVVPQSVQTFDFQAHYNLTPDQALAVSDHYPIELTLYSLESTTRGHSSRASGSSSWLMGTLQQAWQAVVNRFSRLRAGSDL